ncbi:hypothetical protein NQZ68_013386 [Dissostichus eleginoides]|nr:hypothetical protein NQZ68_013386 [Dissostichus eleginoides]
MIAGPEQARLLKEFEQEYILEKGNKQHNHEEGLSTQKTFKEQALALVHTISGMSNPFQDDTPDLLMLDTQNIIDESVVNTVRTVESVGRDQYNKHHKTVIRDKNNSLPGFRCLTARTKTKQAGQISMLRDDVALFSQLYIAMQHREGDMSTFFKHVNHPYPPSLSERGKLRLGKKSDLLIILTQKTQQEPPGTFDVKVLDGAAVVYFLSTTNITTFDEYASCVFGPHIMKLLKT